MLISTMATNRLDIRINRKTISIEFSKSFLSFVYLNVVRAGKDKNGPIIFLYIIIY